MLQKLGTMGAAGLAGCSGDNDSNESEPGSGDSDVTETDTAPEDTSTPEPDYSLPESEHANPVDMATGWMIFPDDQVDALQAVALSPSKLSENLDVSFSEDIGADDKYEMFEFSHEDIPETYVQRATDPWASEYKVDQLPGSVSETSMAHQLKDAGYDFQKEIGNFKIYSDGEEFHALGEDRHITILRNAGADSSQASDLMETVVEEGNENGYELLEIVEVHDKTITASGADLDSSEVGSGSSIVFSVPYI